MDKFSRANEETIKRGNIKLSVFNEFPFDELKPIIEFIQSRGFECLFCDNGNIVFQKKE
jgi:hypothetical protein